VVKEACGYDDYVNFRHHLPADNQCVRWYRWALQRIAQLHPDVVVVGTYANTPAWRQGQQQVLDDMHHVASRVIELSDTPWIAAPAACLAQAGATQGTCLAPLSPRVVELANQARLVAAQTHSDFLSVVGWFCARGRCPSLINGAIPYYDGAHLTPEYSTYLGPALERALNLTGGRIRPLASDGHR
jgi:hypothetical protein